MCDQRVVGHRLRRGAAAAAELQRAATAEAGEATAAEQPAEGRAAFRIGLCWW